MSLLNFNKFSHNESSLFSKKLQLRPREYKMYSNRNFLNATILQCGVADN